QPATNSLQLQRERELSDQHAAPGGGKRCAFRGRRGSAQPPAYAVDESHGLARTSQGTCTNPLPDVGACAMRLNRMASPATRTVDGLPPFVPVVPPIVPATR